MGVISTKVFVGGTTFAWEIVFTTFLLGRFGSVCLFSVHETLHLILYLLPDDLEPLNFQHRSEVGNNVLNIPFEDCLVDVMFF